MTKQTILLVGEKNDTRELTGLLEREGFETKHAYNIPTAYEESKDIKPAAIAIVVPQYWSPVIFYIQAVRTDEKLKYTPIYYMGELIEGGDLRQLKAMDVQVISIGPVPFSEVTRQIVHEIGGR